MNERKNVDWVKKWLASELERLRIREKECHFNGEKASLQGSIMTCRKLLGVLQ